MRNTVRQETDSICRHEDTAADTRRRARADARVVTFVRDFFVRIAAANVWAETLFLVADGDVI